MLNRCFAWWNTCREDEAGAAAPEYAVMLALILAVVFASIALLGENVENAFSDFLALVKKYIS